MAGGYFNPHYLFLVNNLFNFRETDEILGEDLHAIDIQRARDHGIGSYAMAVEKCGFPKPVTFKDMEKFIIPRVSVKWIIDFYLKPIFSSFSDF